MNCSSVGWQWLCFREGRAAFRGYSTAMVKCAVLLVRRKKKLKVRLQDPVYLCNHLPNCHMFQPGETICFQSHPTTHCHMYTGKPKMVDSVLKVLLFTK